MFFQVKQKWRRSTPVPVSKAVVTAFDPVGTGDACTASALFRASAGV